MSRGGGHFYKLASTFVDDVVIVFATPKMFAKTFNVWRGDWVFIMKLRADVARARVPRICIDIMHWITCVT